MQSYISKPAERNVPKKRSSMKWGIENW